MNKYLIAALIAAAGAIIYLSVDRQHQKEEKVRYRANFEVSQTELQYERTEKGDMMAKVGALELTVNEMKTTNKGLVENVKDMKIQMRKLQSYSATSTETHFNFHTQFKDSLIHDTVRIEKLEYKTEWIDLKILKQGLEADVQIQTRDSLIQVVWWERPNRFLFVKYGKKRFSQSIKSANPDSKITYSELILPRKKAKKMR